MPDGRGQPRRAERGRGRVLVGALALALALLAVSAASASAQLLPPLLPPPPQPQPPTVDPPDPSERGRGTVRTGTTGNNSEVVKTIPISKRADAKRRAVMSLQPGNLGDLRDGDRLDATTEVEVSVCLKPNANHGSHRPCIGRTYGYNPTVTAELVLASGSEGTGGVSLGKRRLTCFQSQPNRNHHCVLVIDNGSLAVSNASALPCNAATCHLNLVLSAHDQQAKGGDKLVVGADSGGRSVNGDKGRINFARYRPAKKLADPEFTDARVRPSLSIAAEGGNVREKALYSVKLENLRAGEQLVIDGRAVTTIGQHSYNAFMTTGIVLSERRDSASREGWPERVGDLNGQIAESNGFNCTQGHSAHSDPCVARKVGVLEITRDSPKTLFVNLVAGMAAQLFGEKHRNGDKANVGKRGFLRVYRFPRETNDAPPPVRD